MRTGETDIATCRTCGQPMRATDLIARLTEENEALRKDAERYRQKRKMDYEKLKTTATYRKVPSGAVTTLQLIESSWIASYDAAIDAAIKEGS